LWSGDGEIYPVVITKELPKKTGESRQFHVAFDDGEEGLVYSTSVYTAAAVETSSKHLPLMIMKCLATAIRATTRL
jgi:hypothetical protein